ncbi:PspA/IM30 family protein [Exiguobacterium aurantiacum]|uniref:PspA/IM30 family protein n=1 Tax=Exiguobacterium aurantiacum TaxID=33987 RepID=UPI003CFE5A4C
MKTPFDQFRDLANELTKELSKEMKKFQDKEGPRSAPRSSGEAELNRHIRGAEKEALSVERLVERQKALLDELATKRDDAKLMADKRYEQTELAKQAGEDKLAERAALESKHYGEQYRYFEGLLDEGARELDALERRALEMRLKLDEMQNKRYEFAMRENLDLLKGALDQIFGAETSKTHPFTEEEKKAEEKKQEQAAEEKIDPADEDDFEAKLKELERRFKQD